MIYSHNNTMPYLTSVPNTSAAGISDLTSPTINCDDLNLSGVSVKQTLATICDRLAILTPNPEKLEKYSALRECYEHYKLLESLINDK